MYVCLCKGISDQQILQAVDDGAGSFREVQRQLGVATQCGKCQSVAEELVNEALAEAAAQFDYSLCYAVA